MTLTGDGVEVLICDGPEDALSLRQATGAPVRCPFCASSMGKVPLPNGSVAVLVVDNNPV